MKRVLCTTLALLLASTVFVCCQKDGVFNPKQKIDKIYQAYDGGKILSEEWTWDGNLLNYIAYFKNDTTVLRKSYYFYDKKQLVKIHNTADLSYVIISYNKSYYDRIGFYNKFDRKVRSYAFTYDKKKVSKIVLTVYKNPAKSEIRMENDMMAAFIPKAVLDVTNKQLMHTAFSKADEDDIYTYAIQYDGDNVSEWKISYKSGDKLTETILKYGSYDENMNPYYTSFPNLENVPLAFYKNNPQKITCTQYTNSVEDGAYTYDYTYKYDAKKYPTEVISKQTAGSYSNSDTAYYTYK